MTAESEETGKKTTKNCETPEENTAQSSCLSSPKSLLHFHRLPCRETIFARGYKTLAATELLAVTLGHHCFAKK